MVLLRSGIAQGDGGRDPSTRSRTRHTGAPDRRVQSTHGRARGHRVPAGRRRPHGRLSGDMTVPVEITSSAKPTMLRAPRPDAEVRRLLWQLNLWPARLSGPHVLEDGRRDWQLEIKAFGTRRPMRAVQERTIDGPGGPL